MTAACGGGTSAAKPGFDRLISITPFIMGAAMNNVETKAAMTLAGVLGNFTFDLNNFCTTDPPAMPTITLDDVASILNPINIVAFLAARQKFQDLVFNYLWVYMCECTSHANPPVPTAPTALSSFSADPPTTPPTTSGCVADDFSGTTADLFTSTNPSGPGDTVRFISAAFGEQNGPSITASGYSNPFPTKLIPNGATHYQIVFSTVSGQPNALAQPWTSLIFRNSGGTLLGGPTWNIPQNGSSHTYPVTAIPANSSNFQWQFDSGGAGDVTGEFSIVWFCNSQIGSNPVQPCCPPDVTVSAMLSTILGYVTLIQRQSAPFAYVTGASHSISGAGEINVQGLLGAKVTLGTLPGGVGVESGDPAELWEVGWINWGNPDGFSRREWIGCSPFVSIPAAAGQYTRIGYSLKPGVTATLVELTREP